jgi:hypothetical protein
MKTKVFDCVQMKDKIQEEIYEEMKHLSPEEQVAYYQKAIQEDPQFRDKFARIRASRFAAQPESTGAEGK